MIENNPNEEILVNEEVLKEDNSLNEDIVENSNNGLKEEDSLNIETLDNTTIFTPIVSDGIFEEEILDLNDNVLDINTDESNTNDILEESITEDNKEVVRDNLSSIENNLNDENILDSNNEINDFSISNSVENNIDLDKVSNDDITEKDIQSDVEDFTNLDKESVSNDNSLNDNQKNELINETSNLEKEETKKDNTLLEKYGENLSIKEYVCNPAIGRDNEIKQLILTLLTPEKSGILVGKPGIGKTAIVEGLGYQIQKGNVPDALKDYQIYKLNTSSLLGIMPGTNEPKIQVLLNEIKGQTKLILFIDEIHTLIGAGAEGDDSLDFANIFKPGLDRGNIKIIGATTSDEYDRYILTDKAFVRRFQKIDVLEPTKEHTVKIMMGSLPKLEHKTGAKLKYTSFIQEKIMTFIVDLTTEYRRVYELSARYPDVALTILQQAFSYAVFDNKKEVGIRDVRKAIVNTKLVYPDVIKKELIRFNDVFSDIYLMETPQRLKGETSV